MGKSEIENRYAWQFRGGRGIDNCVPQEWLPVIENLCQAIDKITPQMERPGFYWRDIKEKRGGLAVDYVAPTAMDDAIENLVDAATTEIARMAERGASSV